MPAIPPDLLDRGLLPEEIAFVLEEMAQRKARGWTMEEVATHGGLRRQTISHVAHWRRGMQFATAIKISRAFGVTIDVFTRRARRWLAYLPLIAVAWG